VFSTLHTNDASAAMTRLEDIGVEPYLISSSILCVIAQRLVRVICRECKHKGCESCKGTGYRGRTVIYEILPMSPKIQEAIAQKASAHRIREIALTEGMKTLRQCGLEKVRDGVTTEEEVLRATLSL